MCTDLSNIYIISALSLSPSPHLSFPPSSSPIFLNHHTSSHSSPLTPHTLTPSQVVSVLLRSGQFPQSFLQRSDMPHSALLLAAKSGHNEVIALLVKHGFDVNRKLPGANGNCLHEAALYGKVETVRFLLQVSTVYSVCIGIDI